MKRVCVRDLAAKFLWEIVTGDSEALNRPIVQIDTNRPGLELAGYFPETETERVVVLGIKEIRYINEQMDEVEQRRSFEFLTGDSTPAIVVAHGAKCPEILKEIAQRKNFPVFQTSMVTSYTIINIINYLDECLASSVIIHGELIRIYGLGVLITGESGTGKSEIALELIKRGHQLVADDRVDCYKIHNALVGRTSEMLEGFMEMRGVGIINVTRMFGVKAVAHETQIDLQITLEEYVDQADYDRIGIEEKEYIDIMGVKILNMRIPVSVGRPMATVIETAVTNYILMEDGIDSAKEFEERALSQIAENKTGEEDETVSRS